jgi:hypothetical protein
LLLLSVVPATAGTRSEAYEASAFHLTTAYHCQSVTGDARWYERALEASTARLISAGYVQAEAKEAIETITSALEPEDSPLTEQLCVDLLKGLE